MKKNVKILPGIAALLVMACFFGLWSKADVYADMGPKPSVVIDFLGMEDEEYYVTLLSETESTGPWTAGEVYTGEDTAEREVYQKFASYQDSDGFYFLGCMDACEDTGQFVWGYYPPHRFKILIYFPDTDEFLSDHEIYESYAFDSYYTVNISSGDIEVEKNEKALDDAARERRQRIFVSRSYVYAGEILSLLFRIVITILLELFVAFLFAYRSRKQMRLIVFLNIDTQLFLNVMLNLNQYFWGSFYGMLTVEAVIFIIEAVVYRRKLGGSHPVLYAFAANVLSFAAGFGLSVIGVDLLL